MNIDHSMSLNVSDRIFLLPLRHYKVAEESYEKGKQLSNTEVLYQ